MANRMGPNDWRSASAVDDDGHVAWVQNVNISGATGNTTVVQPTASNLNAQVVGSVAAGATGAANPVGIGFRYNTTIPTYANGQRTEAQSDVRGNLNINIRGTDNQAGAVVINVAADANSNVVNGLATFSYGAFFNGTTWDRARGDTNAAAVQPALTASFWSYAAASGGISNTTTAVTVKAAAGAGVRNYVESIDLSWDSLGAATEIAIRDGAGGTVLWRGKIQQSSAGARTVKFGTALKGTANTLLEVVTLTATVTGGVYVNLQGWTGT